MKLVSDLTWSDGVLPMNALFYPGGQSMEHQFNDCCMKPRNLKPEIQEMLDSVFSSGSMPVSVCVGALAYAAYGVFDGRAATTHWRSLGQLAALSEGTDVRGDERFVDYGDCISSAGISAGVDMSLHFVKRFASADMARRIKRSMQYFPAPPVDAIISPPWRPGIP